MLSSLVSKSKKHEVCRNFAFGSGLGETTAVSVFRLTHFDGPDLSVFIAYESDRRGEELARTALFVGALHLKENRIHRPRHLCRTLCRGLLPNGKHRGRRRVLPVRSAKAVSPGVPASQYHDVLAFSVNLTEHLVTGLNSVGWGEIVHRGIDATEVSSRDGEVARNGGACCRDDSVVTFGQLTPGDIDPDVHPGPKPGALLLHLCETHVQMVLLHLEIRNSVAQKPSDAIIALKDSDRVSHPRQLLCRRETRWSATDHSDRLAGESLGW
ncbi:unannotated protein [freshwater metagenome]|uniref:Unannotated protein n=1 Tax=freshwater metagenome TaxID=449393 RepID=A0A6J6E3E7_9ZZZZ